jgi:hypothetical protein
MRRALRLLFVPVCVSLSIGFPACALGEDDSESDPSEVGAAGSGASSAWPDAGGAQAANECVHTGPPLINPSDLPECPLCGGARCVAKALVPKEQLDQLADCADGTKCVPDVYIAKMGKFVLPTCSSLLGNEGRCVSVCLPQIAAQADRLPRDTCADGELCTPCHDPTTGVETGACSVSCDTGPTKPPILFSECCGGLGSCVPEAYVPAEQKSQLGSAGCSGAGELCAPKILAGGSKPAVCKSVSGGEGRCLPTCLSAVSSQADKLPQDICQSGELCAPCFDPISGLATGSCSINGDTPNGPATTFPACCGGAGACVPKSLVPPAQQAMLAGDSCSDPNALCVPTELTSPTAKPTSCASLGGGEGRCLPKCLPAIAAQAAMLPQSSCPATHVCAPCYDPLSGAATGSCAINGDAPEKPPFLFPKCCAYQGNPRGTCVPSDALSASQAKSLPKDSCPSDAWRCVPNLKLQNPTAKFPACQAANFFFSGTQPGACVPDCMVGGFEGFFISQGSCKSGEKCAPCKKPLGGSSGACD